jgi:radical SAM superfamily enzyme YgiQ (UPF0313 family)
VIREGVDPYFALANYGESLSSNSRSFSPLRDYLEKPETTLVDEYMDEITTDLIHKHQPTVLGLTIPFPGNVYGALRMAMVAKRMDPNLVVIAGGGYVNTELRSLEDPRVFDYLDYITMDDGERPLQLLLQHLEHTHAQKAKGGRTVAPFLMRTMMRDEAGAVQLVSNATGADISQNSLGTPTYEGLNLNSYLNLLEMLNPMHRIWSDGWWNKLTLAHGCYWRRCTFCDVTLDYIK